VFGDTGIADLTDPSRYERYLADYLEGARRCRTPAELRAYGRPADCSGFHRSAPELEATFERAFDAYRDACEAVSDEIDRVEGRRRPFSFRLSVDVEAVLRFFDVEAGVSKRAREDFTWRAGPSAAVVGQRGEVERSVRVPVGAAGITQRPDGRVESFQVEVSAAGAVSAYGVLRRDTLEAGLGSGVSLGGEDDPVRLEGRVRVGVDAALVTPDFVARAIAPGSWFDPPARPPAAPTPPARR
jgi:hypothetical protein